MGRRPEEARDTLARKVGEAFSPGGPLAAVLRGFEPRPGQVALAARWAGALSRGEILLAEAATGIGKTLAYLVPAVLSGRKTKIFSRRILAKVVLFNIYLPRKRDCARTSRRILRIIYRIEFLHLTFRVVIDYQA